MLALMAGVVARVANGKKVTGSDARIPSMWYCDDGKMMAEDVQSLQRMYEAAWIVAKVAGLTLMAGVGMPVGREGPLVHIAGIIAVLLLRHPNFARVNRR